MEWNELMQLLNLQLDLIGYTQPGSAMSLFTIDNQAGAIWDLISGIFDNFLGLFQDLTQIIHILDFLPNNWVRLFLVLLLVVIALRIYSFFADVEIGGFKI